MRRVKRSLNLSSILLFCFGLLVLGTALITELFQAQKTPFADVSLFQNPITQELVSSLEGLSVSNRVGTFEVKLTDSSRGPAWQLTSPRSLPANELTIQSILNALSGLKIKKLFDKDPLNTSSFSLDSPLVSMNLKTANQNNVKVNLGLINPIDNSAYLSLENEDVIYQVEAFQSPIEAYDLADFIDSRLFPFTYNQIKSLTIYRGRKNYSLLSVKKDQETWTGRKFSLDQERWQDHLKVLTAQRSQIILDEIDSKLSKKLERWRKRVAYTVVIKDSTDNEYEYLVSSPISKMEELKLKDRESLFVFSSNKDYPLVISKDLLSLLNRPEKDFKKLEIKKLFY